MSKGRRVGKGIIGGRVAWARKQVHAQMNRDWQIVSVKKVWVKQRMLEWKKKLARF